MTLEKYISFKKPVLMEGALGERLKREFNIKIDGKAAMAPLVFSEKGRNALSFLWGEYIATAEKYTLPIMLTTPTRRANKENVFSAGFNESIIKANTDFLKEVRKKHKKTQPVFIGGLMGCKGDAYTGEGSLSEEDAFLFNSWQANLFAKENIDFLYAGIMPCVNEAVGMAKAMEKTALPYIISFTIQKNGRLIDGTTINDAIEIIDSKTKRKPLIYITNCVHPSIVLEAISKPFNKTETVKNRFLGIQANTSPLPYDVLDGCEDLKTSSAQELAEGMYELKKKHGFMVFGGCCGTDNSHMEKTAQLITEKN